MFDEEEEDEVQTTEGEDYSPHDNRKVENPISYIESIMHVVKCSLSTGLLSMPYEFAFVGYGSGLIGTLVAGIIVTHCLHVLIKSLYKQSKRLRLPNLSYQDTISTALASGPPNFRQCACPLGIAVIIFLLLYQLGTCCVVIVFVARSLKQVGDRAHVLSVEIYLLFILLPCIACNLRRDLKSLAPLSMSANAMYILALMVYMYFVKTIPKPSNEPMHMFGNFYEFPQFFGIVLFSITSVGVVVAVENEMASPQKFTSKYGVLNMSMVIVTGLHCAVGVVGYNFCRDKCGDNASLDLPAEYWLADLAILLFALALLLSFGLHCYVPVQLVWGFIEHELPLETPVKKRRNIKLFVRVGLCLFTFLVAFTVPKLSLFVSLFGALSLSALALIFPAIMEAILETSKIKLVKNCFMVLLGIVLMLFCVYEALDVIVMTSIDKMQL